MHRRWTAVAGLPALVLALGVLGVAVLATCSGVDRTDPEPRDISSLAPGLQVDAPATVPAGVEFVVRVSGGGAAMLRLDVFSAVGVTRIEVPLQAGEALVLVPGQLAGSSGWLRLVAVAGDASGQAEVRVVPGRAVDGIVPLAGPRSMIADGAHWTMVTAIPLDADGNPMPDGTAVKLHVRRPDGSIVVVPGTVDDLLTGIRVFSGTVAGDTAIRVEVDGATGPEVLVAEAPGPPAPFDLVAPATPVRADGRTLIEVSTSVLADRFGNVLYDGTQVTLVADTPDGRVTAVGFTLDGAAAFRLEAPQSPGSMRLVATADGVQSAPLLIDVAAEVTELPVSARRDGDVVTLDIGPVRTALGGDAPDGTSVEVLLPGGTVRTAQLRSGLAVVQLDLPAGAQVTVTVLGVTRQVVLP